MSTLNREEYIADAVRKAGEDFDRMVQKEYVEDLFEHLGYQCTYTGSFMEGMTKEIHLKDVRTLENAYEIFKKLNTAKIYTHDRSCLATDELAPWDDKSTRYDMQIRINTNDYIKYNTIVTFVVWMDNEDYKVNIKLRTNLFQVVGTLENHMGGYVIKNCSLNTSHEWQMVWKEKYLEIVREVKWGAHEGTKYNEFSLFLNVK